MIDASTANGVDCLDGIDEALIDISSAAKLLIAAYEFRQVHVIEPSTITYLARQMTVHAEEAQKSVKAVLNYVFFKTQGIQTPGEPAQISETEAEAFFGTIDKAFADVLLATELLPIADNAENSSIYADAPDPPHPHNVYLTARLVTHIASGQAWSALARIKTFQKATSAPIS